MLKNNKAEETITEEKIRRNKRSGGFTWQGTCFVFLFDSSKITFDSRKIYFDSSSFYFLIENNLARGFTAVSVFLY